MFQDKKLKSQIILTAWGFLLTSIIGACLTFFFNYLEWESRTKYDEEKVRADNRREEIKAILNLCQRRYFFSERLRELLESRRGDQIEAAYKDYKQTIDEWNLNLMLNKLLIEKIISKKSADLFCDSKIMAVGVPGDLSGDSVHTRFRVVSDEIRKGYLEWKKGIPVDNQDAMQKKLQYAGISLQILYVNLMKDY
jgi:hypothetical protein